jgi:amidohydrolase
VTVLDSPQSGPLDPFELPPDQILSALDPDVVDDLGEGRGPQWLDSWMRKYSTDLIRWRRHLHSHPELGHAEFGTTAFIAGMLREAGLAPRILPRGSGLIVDIGTGRRCVALRADMDALPVTEISGLPFASTVEGVAHACGHDAHTAILLGTTLALASAPSLPGRVRLIFQPAEEIQPGGALEVLAANGLEGVDHIFALHCDPRLAVGTVGTRVGAITSAADVLELRLTSPGGHTARPHLTADLIHALGLIVTGLPALLARRTDPRSGTVLTWGTIHAGQAANAIPQEGTLRGMLRTGSRETWVESKALVRNLVHSLLEPTGVGFEMRHDRGVPAVVNDEVSTWLLNEAVTAALGPDGLTTTEQSSGGEDFGWYLENVPGSYARLGVWSGRDSMRDLHQPDFDLDERAIPVGVRVMTHAALTALTSQVAAPPVS